MAIPVTATSSRISDSAPRSSRCRLAPRPRPARAETERGADRPAIGPEQEGEEGDRGPVAEPPRRAHQEDEQRRVEGDREQQRAHELAVDEAREAHATASAARSAGGATSPLSSRRAGRAIT